MKKQLNGLVEKSIGGAKLAPDTDGLTLEGTLTLREPGREVGPFLRDVHNAVCEAGLKSYRLDVRQLTFINSSGIRLFVNWAAWIKQEPAERRYQLTILSDPQCTWQRVSLPAVAAAAPEVVRVS